MREIVLELTDRDGDPVFFVVRSDGGITYDWWSLRPSFSRHFRLYDRELWQSQEYSVFSPCIPFIEAAFAALKETDDGPVHPCPEP